MNNLELLAPAGNFENFVTAINCGADAIYIGAKQFNARGKVENFDAQTLKKATDLAHLHNVRVYMTVNTLVFDEEIDDVVEVVKNALEANVDAFIVQDIGVAEVLFNTFEGIELHASTQMGINNLSGALVAEKLGLKRIVLSRETPLEEIKKIKQNTKLEIECFIQGALCVCFSGNCYASGVLFGESGNRGRCLQLCRLPYTATYKGKELKSGYLLSAKDFNMSKQLKQLADAGVCSLKIEGRARRQGYVAVVVSTYRNILDNNFKTTEHTQNNLKKAFNRGDFCEGYFSGNGKIIDNKIQGHQGTLIGKVVGFVERKMYNTISIKSKLPINKNDGLKIIRNGEEVCSFSAMDLNLKNGSYVINTKASVCVGDNVHLIQDTNLESTLISQKRQIQITAKFVAKQNQKAKLLFFANSVMAEVESEQICEAAKNQAINFEEVKNQISRLGDTSFKLGEIECDLDNVFIPKQILNKMRRDCAEKLENNIINSYKKQQIKINKIENKIINKKTNKLSECVIISEDTTKNINNFDIVIISPKVYNLDTINNIKSKLNKNQKIYLSIPNLMNSNDEIIIKKILEENKDFGVFGNNISVFSYDREIFASYFLNVTNAFCAEKYYEMGAKNICVNFECSTEKIEYLSQHTNANIFAYAKGYMPLMTFAHCPMKNNFNGKCEKCDFKQIEYCLKGNKQMFLSRYKLSQCYFNLKNKNIFDISEKLKNVNVGLIYDYTEI